MIVNPLRQARSIWSVWFLWSIWFVFLVNLVIWLVLFKQTIETGQTNQITVFLRWRTSSASCSLTSSTLASPLSSTYNAPGACPGIVFVTRRRRVQSDARPQATRSRKRIHRNTLSICRGREQSRCLCMVRCSRTVNVGQAPNAVQSIL